MTNNVIGFIRTYYPIVVGTIIGLLTNIGMDLEAEALGVWVPALAGAVYAVGRLLETKLPEKIRWLAALFIGKVNSLGPVYEEQ